MTFPILVGIALDYDIFFVGRVVEFKENGLTTRSSILAGIVETGTIITAAGVIQALAFFGLLLGDIPVLNQLSFYLLCGVLFDTFIVRTLVVPSHVLDRITTFGNQVIRWEYHYFLLQYARHYTLCKRLVVVVVMYCKIFVLIELCSGTSESHCCLIIFIIDSICT